MTAILIASLAVTVGLAVYLIGEIIPARSREVDRRLADIRAIGPDPMEGMQRRRRLLQGEWIMAILQELGARLRPGAKGARSDAQMLIQAGYRRSGAPAIYWGTRLALGGGLFAAGMAGLPATDLSSTLVLVFAAYLGAVGYVLPFLRVRMQLRRRQKEIQHALPDTLDLLVVCVESGLGLNQALVRVSDDIRHMSPLMSTELLYTNAEIRAGTPREEALRHLADRTGVEDLGSLVTMLIQTDRFGTSIARSLRVHSDVMRQKRRQRAEEAAAKTAIKMVFPLVFCIFPGHVRGHPRTGPHRHPAHAERSVLMKYLRIVNRTRNRVLGSHVGLANRWWLRARGFMGRAQPGPGEGLLLSPCRAVHMHGMKYPLDVLFLGREGQVMAAYPDLEPGRRTAWHARARHALEVPAGTIAETETCEGDLVAWLLIPEYGEDERHAVTVDPLFTTAADDREAR